MSWLRSGRRRFHRALVFQNEVSEWSRAFRHWKRNKGVHLLPTLLKYINVSTCKFMLFTDVKLIAIQVTDVSIIKAWQILLVDGVSRNQWVPPQLNSLCMYIHYVWRRWWRSGIPFISLYSVLTPPHKVRHKLSRNFVTFWITLESSGHSQKSGNENGIF